MMCRANGSDTEHKLNVTHWTLSFLFMIFKSKVKYRRLHSTLPWETHHKGAQVWHMLMRDHTVTCHPHVYPQVEWAMPAFSLQTQSIITLWPVLISHPAEGRRLSWPRWLVKHRGWFANMKMITHPSSRGGQESNSRPLSHKSNVLTTV